MLITVLEKMAMFARLTNVVQLRNERGQATNKYHLARGKRKGNTKVIPTSQAHSRHYQYSLPRTAAAAAQGRARVTSSAQREGRLTKASLRPWRRAGVVHLISLGVARFVSGQRGRVCTNPHARGGHKLHGRTRIVFRLTPGLFQQWSGGCLKIGEVSTFRIPPRAGGWLAGRAGSPVPQIEQRVC